MRLFVLVLALSSGCALAHVRHDRDGTAVTGWVVGHAVLEHCAPRRSITSPAGAFVGPCTRIRGGPFSTTFAAILAGLGTAAVAILTRGMVW